MKKNPKDSFYLLYVEECTPHLKKFDSKSALDRFVKDFKTSDDDWIDFSFKGKVLEFFNNFYCKK
jgi:hypothetical protein